MSLPVKVTMEDGTEILLICRDGTGVMEGLREQIYFRCYQASTRPYPERPQHVNAFGATENEAIAALLEKLQGAS